MSGDDLAAASICMAILPSVSSYGQSSEVRLRSQVLPLLPSSGHLDHNHLTSPGDSLPALSAGFGRDSRPSLLFFAVKNRKCARDTVVSLSVRKYLPTTLSLYPYAHAEQK